MSSQPVEPEHANRDFRGPGDTPRPGLLVEFWAFLKQNKKWWLVPILLVALLFGALVILSGTGLALFIYPSG